MTKSIFALDSVALLTYLNGEPGHTRVTQILRLAQKGQVWPVGR